MLYEFVNSLKVLATACEDASPKGRIFKINCHLMTEDDINPVLPVICKV